MLKALKIIWVIFKVNAGYFELKGGKCPAVDDAKVPDSVSVSEPDDGTPRPANGLKIKKHSVI